MRIQPFRLLALPEELLTHILAQLDHTSLLRCSQTCSVIRGHIRASLLLSYKLELARDSLQALPESNHSTAEAMAHLDRRRRAWATVTPTWTACVPLDGECHAYELVGGVFGKAMSAAGSVFAASRTLAFFTFPDGSAPEGTEPHLLLREDIGLAIRDFAIDPGQDLLILVQTEHIAVAGSGSDSFVLSVHLRNMSRNASHPHAALAVLTHTFAAAMSALVIHVAGDVIAIFGWVFSNPHLLIWNWRKGCLLVSFALDALVGQFDDFTLLAEDTFMLTRLAPQASLELYRFATDTAGLSPPPDPTHLLTLLLPDPASGASYFYIGAHTGPFLTTNETAYAPLRHLQPFMHDFSTPRTRKKRIVVLSISVRPARVAAGTPFTVFVHADALLNLMSERGKCYPEPDAACCFLTRDYQRAREAKGPTLPWAAWGPGRTRWADDVHQPQWLRYVHGSRFVRAAEEDEDAGTSGAFVLLEFDVGPHDADVEASDTIIDADDLFAEDVRSRLPYRETVRATDVAYSGYMIDEDRIMGLIVDHTGNLTGIDAMIF
ncbi:hypothetical protein AURDEDRAFT_187184 [Auricularia subglabra TFB-10046 SS5]|nr:hypothetical protein AURDEDRAFT_187184 [Auricularia subglabra TFB-10046 SS5]